jgi:hypothetical protein
LLRAARSSTAARLAATAPSPGHRSPDEKAPASCSAISVDSFGGALARPCRNAFSRELCFPSNERGPVAGWLLFAVASTGYGAVRVHALRNWPIVASRSIGDTLDKVFSGRCDFADFEHLIPDLEDIEERGEQPTAESVPSRDPP